MNSESRCGKLLSPSVSDIGDHCCLRQEMGDTGRCAWHAENDNKPVASLSAIIDTDETGSTPICSAYLRNQSEQRRLTIQGLEFVEPNFKNVDLFESIEDTTFRQGKLENVDLFNANLENTTFDDVDISNSDFDRIDAGTVEFANCNIYETSFTEFSSDDLVIGGCTFSEVEFSEGTIQIQISKTKLEDVTIRSKCDEFIINDAKLFDCNIPGTVLKQGQFSRCEIENLDLTGTRVGVDFHSCELYDIQFQDAQINTEFTQTDIHLAAFTGATVSKLEVFGPCNLSGLEFQGSETEVNILKIHQVKNLFGLYLENTRLSELVLDDISCNALYIKDLEDLVDGPRYEFSETTITGGHLDNFTPDSLELDDVDINLVNGNNITIPEKALTTINETMVTDCHFSNLEYQPPILGDLNFSNSMLFHADFNGVTIENKRALENNTLAYTDLSESDLSLARLTGSNLFGADLTEADLEGADLRRASFEAATLIGVNFRDVRIDRSTSFDERLYLHLMSDVRINNSQTSVVHKQEKSGLANRFERALHKSVANVRRIYHSISGCNDVERLEQKEFLLPCIEIYRELQRLHSENGQPKKSRHYRIRSREARRKLALAQRKPGRWALSEFINRFTLYGESWMRLLVISGLVVVGSGLLYPFLGGLRFSSNNGQTTRVTSEMLPNYLPVSWVPFELPLEGLPDILVTFLASMYFSVVTFTTLGYGDAQPVGPAAKLLAGFESLSGVVLMAVLVFVLTRKATR